ncbi:MAG: SusC/RagA family TonB-linked outer membrane protein [Tannerella sp.]|nr:SusC/RagA family TonB-linked outer membrane protein [Tannerella sp.]
MKKISILAVSVLFSVSAYAQQITVTGTVLDTNREPIPGASIAVKGTQQGTLADADGKFSVKVPDENAVLQISFLGFETQEITVGTRRVIDVTLTESASALDEVVVVGYGTQRVRDLTGSAVAVNVDELIQVPGVSILDALAGQVVGLGVTQANGRPGSVGQLTVRGAGFLALNAAGNRTAFTNPLIVIDDVVQLDDNGEPSMAAFNRLDYSEIESLTILKDASAAIYGVRASSGVIVIKTKRGTSGKMQIDYSGKFDFSDAVSHTKVMDAYETGLFTNRMIMQQYENSKNTVTGLAATDNRRYMYTGDELMQMKGMNYDWLDEAWSSATSQRHSLTVNGGKDNVSYFAGINYQNPGNNLGKAQDYDRWTYRAGGEVKLMAGMKLSASISGYNSSQTTVNRQRPNLDRGPWGPAGSADYAQLRHMPKYIPWSVDLPNSITGEPESNWMSIWTGPMDTSNPNNASLGGRDAWNFFANEASGAKNVNERNGYNANFSLTYDVPFIKGLSLKAIYATSYDNSGSIEQGGRYNLVKPLNIRDVRIITDQTMPLINWNRLTYGEQTNITDRPTVSFSKSVNKSTQISFWATYNRTFGAHDEHDITATFVAERGETSGNSMQLFYMNMPETFKGTSESAINPIVGADGSTSTNLSSASGDTYYRLTEAGSMSYVGRLNYKYGNRYLLEFLIRSDASTKFAPENYWGVFPGGSVGWVLSEEKFFQNSKIAEQIDFLKFRYSWGKTGKDNATAWRWMETYTLGAESGMGPNGQLVQGANPSGTANRNIKWDQSIKQNFGMDMNILDNRLSATVEYWKDNTSGIIMEVISEAMPIYIGQRLPERNYGEREAWGWEFSLRWSDKIEQSLMPSWGPIRYAIGADYGISWRKTVLGNPFVWDFPGYISNMSDRTGWRSTMGGDWGFKTWKETSMGDGILRTQGDIDKYWAYLTANAEAIGGSPGYLGITNKSDMKPGMLAYQDLRGSADYENETIAGPDGIITRERSDDYAKLSDGVSHSIPVRLNFSWGNFNWQTNIQNSWGGMTTFGVDGDRQSIGSDDLIWAQFEYVNDMFDPTENPNGKYPSMIVSNAFGIPSDFWMVSSFRSYVRNMSFSYSFPKAWLDKTKLGIEKLALSLTGNNLWDFYNPYPYKYRNMYDAENEGYPTLRTWSLSVNASF